MVMRQDPQGIGLTAAVQTPQTDEQTPAKILQKFAALHLENDKAQ